MTSMKKQPRAISSSVSSVLALVFSASAAAQVPPPPGPASPVPPPPPPAASPEAPNTGAATDDLLVGGNPDVATEPSSPTVATEGSLALEGEVSGAAVDGEVNADGATAEADATKASAAAGEAATSDAETALRAQLLRNQSSLRGSTGLLRVHSASSAPAGTFRFGLLTSYMSATGFLCPQCEDANGGDPSVEDDMSRVGVHALLNATVLPFLEAY